MDRALSSDAVTVLVADANWAPWMMERTDTNV